MLNQQRNSLEIANTIINNSNEINSFLISGSSGCGKKEFIKLLAKLNNKEIEEIALASTCDSVDLLGAYD